MIKKQSRMLDRPNEKSRVGAFTYLYATMIALLSIVCYKLFYRMCTEYHGRYISDFPYYIQYAQDEGTEKRRLLSWLFGLMYRNGVGLYGMVIYHTMVIAGIILTSYFFLLFYTKHNNIDKRQLQIASLFAIFLGPIYVPRFHEYYYRYSFQTFAWHSPTEQSMVLFSTLAILSFIIMYEKSKNGINLKYYILTMLFSFLSAFAKPAFVIDLILAMIIMFIIDLFLNGDLVEELKKRVLMGTSLIPSGLYMLVIMNDEFDGQDGVGGGSIAISLQHLFGYKNIFGAIICGLAFPIIVWAANCRLIGEKRYKTVFMVFIMGVFQWTVFVEQGVRATHGNFTWGRQIGSYFFFITAIAMAINNWQDKDFMKNKLRGRIAYFGILLILLLLHIGTQLRYFYLLCMGYSYMQ